MDNVATKIPDVWYDLYVRLIPGTVFVSTALFVFGAFPKIDSIASAVWILIAGYVLGFLLSPLSAVVARRVEVAMGQTRERNKIRPAFPAETREVLVLSKIHAETVGMIACGLFTALLFAMQTLGLPFETSGATNGEANTVNGLSNYLLTIAFSYFIGMAFERAFAGRQRALNLQERPEYWEYVRRRAENDQTQI